MFLVWMQGLEGRVLEKRPVDGFPAAPLRPQPGKSSCPHQNKDYRKVVLIFSFIEEGRGLEGPELNNISKIKI